MANVNNDVYRKMDEEYGNDIEKIFGAGLLTWPQMIDSSRMYMYTSNLKQILCLINPDVPHVLTGYENVVGRYNHAFKNMKGVWVVKDIIPKFGNKTVYMMILYNEKDHMWDMVEKQLAENLPEKFGYMYDTSAMDSLNIGDSIADKPLYKSTSYDKNMNYRMGKNANVAYMTANSTIEDAIKISRRWANSVKIAEIDTVTVPINDNDILLNLYGDSQNYKTFPNVGEPVIDGYVCATRRVNLAHALYDFKDDMVNRIMDTDVSYVTSKNSIIYDMDIFYNGDGDMPVNSFTKQIKVLYDMECKYADAVTEWATRIKNMKSSGEKYTDQVSYYRKKYMRYTDKSYKWKNKDRAFSNIILEFKTCAIVSLEEGFKITGRYGDKGIISCITDCGDKSVKSYNNVVADKIAGTVTESLLDMIQNFDIDESKQNKMLSNIQIVDDCDMPYTEDGTSVDILLNSSGAIRRENIQQLIEHGVTHVGEYVRRLVAASNDRDYQLSLIFKYLDILNSDEAKFFYNVYSSYDQVVEVDNTVVRYLDKESQDAFIQDIIDNGFYIVLRPGCNVKYDVICKLYDSFPDCKPSEAYIDLFGIKGKKIMRPLVIASKYMLVLKQTSNKNFSARSTGRIDKKGLPAKSNDKKTNLAAYNTNPIKIGETHNLFAAVDGENIAEFNIFTRSSPIGRKSLDKILKVSDPCKIEELRIEDSYKNQNAIILNAYLRSMGLAIEFEQEEDDSEVPENEIVSFESSGVTFVTRHSKEPIIKLIMAKYREFMETHVYISVTDPTWKIKKVVDEVFEDEEIKNTDLLGVTKDFILQSILDSNQMDMLKKAESENVAEEDPDEILGSDSED